MGELGMKILHLAPRNPSVMNAAPPDKLGKLLPQLVSPLQNLALRAVLLSICCTLLSLY